MTPGESFLHYLPAVLTTFFGGGAAQILMKLWTRRSDLRQTDTTSDLNVATAESQRAAVTSQLITQLQADGNSYRRTVTALQDKVQTLDDRYDAARRAFAEQLNIAHIENTRLVAELARVTTDLDLANARITQLRALRQPPPSPTESP